eukprot:scaffold91973_cov41-Tisochrysis_lutea.AAC.4
MANICCVDQEAWRSKPRLAVGCHRSRWVVTTASHTHGDTKATIQHDRHTHAGTHYMLYNEESRAEQTTCATSARSHTRCPR